MNKLLKLWDEFWFSRFDPISVSIFRISLGLLMFVFYIANFPNWERFYSASGIISASPSELHVTRWWSLFTYTEGIIPIKTHFSGDKARITFARPHDINGYVPPSERNRVFDLIKQLYGKPSVDGLVLLYDILLGTSQILDSPSTGGSRYRTKAMKGELEIEVFPDSLLTMKAINFPTLAGTGHQNVSTLFLSSE